MIKSILNNLGGIMLLLCLLISGLIIPNKAFSADKDQQICNDTNQYIVRRLDSEQEDDLCQVYKGQLLLVVNTASLCAYTRQYDELEKLYAEYRERGLVVIGFPSNDFGNQEPDSEQKIKNFCSLTYGVQFPMYSKTRVIGNNANPLYKKLAEASGQVPKWNFHKYLINRQGVLIGSYRSNIKPYHSQIIEQIETHL